jgi:N-acetylglucosamine-6-phosphate deacetylase
VFVVKGRVNEDGEILAVPRNTLCSSKLTMDKAFENLLNLLTVDFQGFMIDRKALHFDDALRYTAMFTAGNQALLQGKSDDTGSIEPGKLADLAVLAIHGEPGRYSAEVRGTYVNGNILSSG